MASHVSNFDAQAVEGLDPCGANNPTAAKLDGAIAAIIGGRAAS